MQPKPDGNSAAELQRDHEEQRNDLTPYMEGALESVIETIMLWGQYPQPKRRAWNYSSFLGKQFDLMDYIMETFDPTEIAEFALVALTDYEGHALADLRRKWDKKLEAMLAKHLAGHEIVTDRAEQLRDEERADA